MIIAACARYALPSLLLTVAATAQSRPGISFDQTMRTVTTLSGRTDSATIEMHMTAAGSDAQIEVLKGELMAIGPFAPGAHGVMIMRDSGKEMVLLNSDQKQFVLLKPFEMMERTQKMMESMGGSMTLDTSVTRIANDSLGPGPVIDGHPTLTYRITAVLRMTMSMIGEPHVVDHQSTQEIQAATDLGDFSDLTAGVNRLAELPQSTGFPKGYFDKFAATTRKMRGFPVRVVMHSTISTDGSTRTVVQTIETRNIKRVTVPDSLFAIPAGYKPVTLPGLPGTGM